MAQSTTLTQTPANIATPKAHTHQGVGGRRCRPSLHFIRALLSDKNAARVGGVIVVHQRIQQALHRGVVPARRLQGGVPRVVPLQSYGHTTR